MQTRSAAARPLAPDTLGGVKEPLEREVKLAPGRGFVLPELGGEPQPTRRFISTYHDTPDLVLARHGLTLRHRVEDGAGAVAAEAAPRAPRGSSSSSPARRPGRRSSCRRSSSRSCAAASSRRSRGCGRAARSSWRAVPRSSTTPSPCSRASASSAASASSRSSSSAATSGRSAGSRRSFGRRAPRRREQRPKLFRALDLDPGRRAGGAARRRRRSRALGVALAQQARRLLIHDPGTRLGSDPEDLHQLRVATRRLRAFLQRRGAAPRRRLVGAAPRGALAGWAARSGPHATSTCSSRISRAEIDALGDDAASAAGILDALEASARARAGPWSRRSRATATSRSSTGSSTSPRRSSRGRRPPLEELWGEAWKRARKKLERLDASSADDELHRARIKLKRARYAAELAAAELGKSGTRFGKSAARMQDVLGVHQDAVVAEARLRAWADTGRRAASAVGLPRAAGARPQGGRRALRPVVWKELRRAAKRVG